MSNVLLQDGQVIVRFMVGWWLLVYLIDMHLCIWVVAITFHRDRVSIWLALYRVGCNIFESEIEAAQLYYILHR